MLAFVLRMFPSHHVSMFGIPFILFLIRMKLSTGILLPCSLCPMGGEPLNKEAWLNDKNKSCGEFSSNFTQYGLNHEDACTTAIRDLKNYQDICGCPEVVIMSEPCTLCPEGGDPFNLDKKPDSLKGKTCKEYSDEFIKYGLSSDEACTEANKKLETLHSECSCRISSSTGPLPPPVCTLCPEGGDPANLDKKPDSLNGKTCKEYSDEFIKYGLSSDEACTEANKNLETLHSECSCRISSSKPLTGPKCTLCVGGDIPTNADLKPEGLNGKTCKEYSDEFSVHGIATDPICQAEVTKARLFHRECGCQKFIQEPEPPRSMSRLYRSSSLFLSAIGFGFSITLF